MNPDSCRTITGSEKAGAFPLSPFRGNLIKKRESWEGDRMAAAAKPNQLPKTNPPNRTLADTVAIARAKGDFRQKYAKPLTPAEAEASARHDNVTSQIEQLFLRSEAGEKIAAVPVTKRDSVFQNELCRLHDELLGKVLSPAIGAYAELAKTHRSELPDDPMVWVKAQVDADLAVVRGWWEQWVRCVVSLNADVSFNTDVPAWINYPELHFALGRVPSDIELSAALTAEEAEGALGRIWLKFRRDLGKAVDGVLLDEKGKLAAVPASKHRTPTAQRTRKTKIDQSREEQIICKILPRQLKGMAYCRAVDGLSIPTRLDWQANGCPATYAAAYLMEKWRGCIDDEHTRLNKILKTRHTSPACTASKN